MTLTGILRVPDNVSMPHEYEEAEQAGASDPEEAVCSFSWGITTSSGDPAGSEPRVACPMTFAIKMTEYKSVAIDTTQGWGGSKGKIDCRSLDEVLNEMAQDGWELTNMEGLEHTAGTRSLLCIFQREKRV